MVIKKKTDSFTLEGLQNFGYWLWIHRTNTNLWTLNLKEWFEQYCIGCKKLSQADLCLYLADGTGYEELAEYYYHYKTIEKWRDSKSLKELRVANISLQFALAISKTEFLTINGNRIGTEKIDILKEVLDGRIDPRRL